MKRLEWIDPLSGQVRKMPEPREIVRRGEGLARGFSRGEGGKLSYAPEGLGPDPRHTPWHAEYLEEPKAAQASPFGHMNGLEPGWYLLTGTEQLEARWWSGQGLSGAQYLSTLRCRGFESPKDWSAAAGVDYWTPEDKGPEEGWNAKLSLMTTLRITE